MCPQVGEHIIAHSLAKPLAQVNRHEQWLDVCSERELKLIAPSMHPPTVADHKALVLRGTDERIVAVEGSVDARQIIHRGERLNLVVKVLRPISKTTVKHWFGSSAWMSSTAFN
jgi:hypothetical protein